MFNSITNRMPFLESESKADGDDDYAEVDVDVDEDQATPTQSFVAPDKIDWYSTKANLNDDIFVKNYAISTWPANISSLLFQSLFSDANLDIDFVLHADPYEKRQALKKLETLENLFIDKQNSPVSQYTPDTAGVGQEMSSIQNMKQVIQGNNQTLFDVSAYLTVYAETEEALDEAHENVVQALDRAAGVSTYNCPLEQNVAMESAAPTGINKMGNTHSELKQLMLDTHLAQTYPFIQDQFMEPGGVFFGINENSSTPVTVDIFNRSNGYHRLVMGMIGSGKSFSVGMELLDMEAQYNNLMQFIIDPMGGFVGVNAALGGDRIVINGNESINPMEIEPIPEHVLDRSGGQIDPWKMKKQELLWFFSQFFAAKGNSLSGQELNTLDFAITHCYRQKGITEDPSTHHKESPTITDLRETLEQITRTPAKFSDTDVEQIYQRQSELASEVYVALSPFREGGEYHNLAQPTDISLSDNDVIYLDLSHIPAESDDLGIMMQLLFMKLYRRAKQTRKKVSMTIDEAHKLMRDETLLSGLEEMFRHGRHFDLSINLLTQTPEEFFANDTSATIAKQCVLKRFHRVDHLDRDIAKNELNLNERQIQKIENAESGSSEKDYSQALLSISDEDRVIPLRVKATEADKTIIDWEPNTNPQDYPTPYSQKLAQALDTFHVFDEPLVSVDENELLPHVYSQVIEKRQNNLALRAKYAPDTLTKEEQEHVVEESLLATEDNDSDAQTSDDAESDDTDSSLGKFDSADDLETIASRQNSSVKEVAMKKNLQGPSGVDNLDPQTIRVVARSHNIGNPDIDRIPDLKDRIREHFYGTESNAESDTEPADEQESTKPENVEDTGTQTPE